MSLTKIRFSSKLPPRTEYWELISLAEDTPGSVFIISDTPLVRLGATCASRGSRRTMLSVRRFSSLTSNPGKVVDTEISSTLIRCDSPGFRFTCTRFSEKPTNENTRMTFFSAGTDKSNSPLLLVEVPTFSPSMITLASSTGCLFSSVTLPYTVAFCPSKIFCSTNEKININDNWRMPCRFRFMPW